MTTRICAACGTRNAEDAATCRRCNADLGDALGAQTMRGSPTASVLGERWVVDGPAPGTKESAGLFVGHDLREGIGVLMRRIPPAITRDRASRSQLLHEARVLSRLHHVSLLRVLDVIEDNTNVAVIYEHRGERTLEELLAFGWQLPVGIAIGLVRRMIEVICVLHERGIVHRQLTPRAVRMRTNTETNELIPVLGDFALTQLLPTGSATGGRAASGTLMGMRPDDVLSLVEPTPYTAPEVLTFEAEARSDLYALGGLLYVLLTGRPPVVAASADALNRLIHTETPPALRALRPELSAALEELVASLLHKLPNKRPADARVLLQALDATPEAMREQMVPVPGGAFFRGARVDDPDARREEQPGASINLSPFWIDRTCVSCAQFAAFVEATGREMVPEWFLYNDPEHQPDLPVVYVTWHDAAAYASWANKRLPTEAEWERAARGRDARIYPWGDSAPRHDLVAYEGLDRPVAVAAMPGGASPVGALNMAGNVFEWVQDWFERAYYKSAPSMDPTGPATGSKRVLRGGSFVHPAFALRCSARGRYAPDEHRANHSFRCAWTAPV
jgi:formylglycine-generating enzyme required for sulfatase activity